MAKQKTPTPQELYWAKKEREEQEKDALLPPGLVNHGNTCFMNSVLQGLISTQILSDLAQSKPLSSAVQLTAPTPLAARRSPELTNGHGTAGSDEQERVEGMPLGDTFIAIMLRAWSLQATKNRESMSPKDLLSALGQKYEQYLDFRQQDAHEFLRQLLDAMRMEELDVIKKRQPLPPKDSRRARRTSQPNQLLPTVTPSQPLPSSSVTSQIPSAPPSSAEPTLAPPAEDEKLISFVDMIFGGRLTSILICQKCKHISQTYEDFNDLSLSIKPEDYTRERKRDRLKIFAKKLKNLPALGVAASTEAHRSSSVPASPRENKEITHDFPFATESRRRSLDIVGGEPAGEDENIDPKQTETTSSVDTDTSLAQEAEGSTPSEPPPEAEVKTEVKATNHVGFAAQTKAEKKDRKEKDDDGWVKLGRRISMTVGMKKKKSRSRDPDRELHKEAQHIENSALSAKDGHPQHASATPTPIPQARSSHTGHHSRSLDSTPPSTTPFTPEKSDYNFGVTSSTPTAAISRFPQLISRPSTPLVTGKRDKPPRLPKPTPEEAEFIRCILADVTLNSPHSFALFKPPGGLDQPPLTAAQMYMKLGRLPGVEECLRMFTAVEDLNGENMVGCHRCWKIENGEYKPRPRKEGQCFADDTDSDENEKASADTTSQTAVEPSTDSMPVPHPPGISSPANSVFSAEPHSPSPTSTTSTLPTSLGSISTGLKDPPPFLPLPLVGLEIQAANYGGFSIPVISTTGPDPSLSPPGTARPSDKVPIHSGLNLPTSASRDSLLTPTVIHRRMRDGDTDSITGSADESSDGGESDVSAITSIYSDLSSVSLSASPSASRHASMEQLPSARPSAPPSSAGSGKVPRSQQVVMSPAYKRYLIATPPPVLVIHLKRFQQIAKTHMISFSTGFKKLDDFVSFPEYLDLTPFLAPKKEDFGLGRKSKSRRLSSRVKPKDRNQCMYRLYAVVVHIGNMLGGHYIAYTALPDTNADTQSSSASATPEVISNVTSATNSTKPARQWSYISDTVVRIATLEEVLKAKAYICMYERI